VTTSGRAIPKIRVLDLLLYLLPLSLLLGTNVPAGSIGDRIVYVGTTEVVIGLLMAPVLMRFLGGHASMAVPGSVLAPLLLFSCVVPGSLVARILATGEGASPEAYIETIRWFEYLAVFLIVLSVVQHRRQLQILLGLFIIASLLNAGVALFQSATFDVMEARIYGLLVSGSDRAGTSVSNPNVAGSLFMIGGVFLGAFAIHAKRRKSLYLALCAVMVVAGLMTLSRSAILGLGTGALMLVVIAGQRVRAVVLAGAVLTAFCLTVWASDVLRGRLVDSFHLEGDTVAAQSILLRLEMWQDAFLRFEDHPILGAGFGEFRSASTPLAVDNYYLEILATTGIVGLTILLWLFGAIILFVWRVRAPRDSPFFAIRAGYLGSIAGLLVASFFGGLLFNPRILGSFWLLTGIAICGARLSRRESVSRRFPTVACATALDSRHPRPL
jgi:O-antigen ligase